MSHALERLLARLDREVPVEEIKSSIPHSTVDHAVDRGLIEGVVMDERTLYRITEAGQAAMIA